MTKLEAFILTGGRSTRMGRDKAHVEFDGIALAERTAEIVRASPLFSRARFVGGESTDENFVADVYADRGPLGGLHAALNVAGTEWIFLLGCDLPFVTNELISRLGIFCADNVDAVVPVQEDGRVQPLCGFYRVAACRTAAADLLESADRRALKDLLKLVRARPVAFAEISDLSGGGHFFLNLNTPSDLETALSIAAAKRSVAK